MKFKCLVFFSLLIPIWCYAEALTPNINAPETLDAGGKQWKIGYKDENSVSKIVEYVTNSENINNWTELFTIQKFNYPFLKLVTPRLFADKEVESLKTKGYKYVYSTLLSTAQEAIIEFRVSSPDTEKQDEIQRLIKTPDDKIVVIHYSIRKEDMGQEERNKMVSALKAIDFSTF